MQLIDSDRNLSNTTAMDATSFDYGKRNLEERTRNTSSQTEIANIVSTSNEASGNDAITILNQHHTNRGATTIDILDS